MFARVKRHETRGRKPPLSLCQAPFVLHAAKKMLPPIGMLPPGVEALMERALGWRGVTERDPLPYGAGLGLVRILRAGPTDEIVPLDDDDRIAGDWSPGRWAWELEVVEHWDTPIAARGMQGVWRWAA